jgi:hypothetical protein
LLHRDRRVLNRMSRNLSVFVTTTPGQTQHWRLLVREWFVEVYIDDMLIQCYTLPHTAGGRLGFGIEEAAATITNVGL